MLGGFSTSRISAGRMRLRRSSLPGCTSTPVCLPPSRLRTLTLVCNSSASSNSKPNMRRKIKKGNNTGCVSSLPSVGAAATVAAATVTAAVVEQAAVSAARASDITLVNPPLGFSNNIVPARPLVVTQPQPSVGESVDSSDEDLDDSRSALPATGAAGRSSAWRCLILDSRYVPVNVVNWHRAVVMDMSGKADVLEYHPGGFAFSAYKQHPLPAVLRVRAFVDVHEFAGRLSLTRKNIMLRDHYRCQYCGCSKELTLDHITPVCRGGVNSWQNLVTACMSCNQRKGDKGLQQLGWKLPCVPREPSPQEVGIVAGISKSDLEHPPVAWVPYLASFKAALEKAQKRAAAAAASGGSSSSSSNTRLIGVVSEQQELLSSKQGSGAAKVAVAVASKASAKRAAAAKRMRS